MILRVSKLLGLLPLLLGAYYLLLHQGTLPSSIDSFCSHAHQLEHKQHMIMLALLPVYIGMCIFGSAIIGNYLGTRVQFIFCNKIHKR